VAELPDPIIPSDVDLKDFPFTPMFRARLFGSSFHARVSDSGWRAGVTLWLKSWDQVPAGTLPDDEIDLCRLAELGKDIKLWRKLSKEALWGWFKCSDGRLHHKVVAEGIMNAWNDKQAQRDRTAKARAAKAEKRKSQPWNDDTTEIVTFSVTDNVTHSVTGSKRREEKGSKEDNPLDSDLRPTGPSRAEDDFERKIRDMVGKEPVKLAQDFHVINGLLENPDITEADVAEGVGIALRRSTNRIRAWSSFENWILNAAKDRLARIDRQPSATPKLPPTDSEPRIPLPGGNSWPEQAVISCLKKFRTDRRSWPDVLGFPPGHPSCVIPAGLIAEHVMTTQ
jgi:hypothetical protein